MTWNNYETRQFKEELKWKKTAMIDRGKWLKNIS